MPRGDQTELLIMAGLPRTITGIIFTALTAGLALLLLRLFGLSGPLALIGLFGLSWLGFYLWRRRAQRLIRKKFAQMSGRERVSALYALSETERAEILAALKDEDQ